MKYIKLISFIAIIFVASYQLKAQVIYENGMLGINTTPAFTLDVRGSIRFNDWTDVILDTSGDCNTPNLYPEQDWGLQMGFSNRRLSHIYSHDINSYNVYEDSDKKIKENILYYSGTLEKVKMLKAVSYNIKDEFLTTIPEEQKHKYKKKQIGFIAQDVEKIFPEVVCKNDNGRYAIKYTRIIPILVESIKEQQNQISTIQNIVYSQENEIIELKKEVEKLTTKDNKLKSSSTINNTENLSEQNSSILMQNIPNPFTMDTEIKYYIAEVVSTASLIIHNMQGIEISNYPISERGNGSKTIKAIELEAGMYLYTLIADGKIIDSKRMILTSE